MKIIVPANQRNSSCKLRKAWDTEKAAAPKRTNTVIIPNEKKIDEITALRRILAGITPSFFSPTSPAPAI